MCWRCFNEEAQGITHTFFQQSNRTAIGDLPDEALLDTMAGYYVVLKKRAGRPGAWNFLGSRVDI
jgi:nitrous oxide reductase accessory protein NosL